ncbi:MAG: hypothetical protein IKP96_02245 [Elusimicrobiaceae bacterium]|nr:hypothetical protein [Elusimicrobiaceae bacterium]
MAKKTKKCEQCAILDRFGDFGLCRFGGNEPSITCLGNTACKMFVPKGGKK